jgi:hypothetical protein
MVCACALLPARGTGEPAFTHSAIVTRDGYPTLLVDGRPFFFYGAAFFYERLPAPQWRASMLALRTLGFNTLDLYVPWNWHELDDGDYDFDGRTNPRRNLRAVLALARELQFKLIVRPGPVIRNEWRNGGYPAWLLTRPEYGMPLHDILEGRYPSTATLQNANSDDAAAQWLANATHMRYASRWLRTALHEFVPFADQLVAVQLDDDQGAYIDNQTWPAPHLAAYLGALETVVRSVVGSQLPVFINTYEMKVTASAPVWAMGNWYQSEAYSIGEHDRAALEFSTGLLQTQTRFPVAMSEFQAGWLAPPEDPAPRAADPTNTTLALHTLLGLGMRGVIDFPAQDTINPAGWEAPFANLAYAWDAALDVSLAPSARYAPTKRFGDLVRTDGAALADARRLADGAIAYLPSAYDERRQTNADVFAIVARTQAAQQACRARHLTCNLVDLRFIADGELRRYPFLIVPRIPNAQPLTQLARARLARYRGDGGRIVGKPPDVVTPVGGGIADATVLLARDGTAFLDIVNYDAVPRAIPATRIALPNGRTWEVGPLRIPARDALLLRDRGSATSHPISDARASTDEGTSRVVPGPPAAQPQEQPQKPQGINDLSPATRLLLDDDRAADGYPRLTLSNDLVNVTLAPNAGARAFSFAGSSGGCSGKNVFTSVGALRDDVALQPPVSSADRIGKYTRSFPAGMFNRPYHVATSMTRANAASVTLQYTAPDVIPGGAQFERTVEMRAGEPGFTIAGRALFGAGANAGVQRAVRYDSFDTRGATIFDDRANGAIGFFYGDTHCVAVVAWPVARIEDAQLIPERTSMVLRLQFASGESRTRYTLEPAADPEAARATMLKERATVSAKR